MAISNGFSGKLYRLSTGSRATWNSTVTSGLHVGACPSNLDEVPNVKDITIPTEMTEVDTTTRTDGGFATSFPGLAKIGVDISMNYDPSDSDFLALQTAFLTRANIALAILDGDKATAGTIGLWADFRVFKMEKGEPLDGIQTVVFTVKPGPSTVAPEYVKVS